MSVPGGIQGAPGGQLYALTVTTTDYSASGSTLFSNPINIVAGGHGGDTIDLASLPGIATRAPTFIYGLGNGASVDGTGMTGTLYFDSGAGADTMTGGSGANVYEYGSAAGSSSSAMDIITNFNVAVDLIDLTGLGTSFSTAAALAGTDTSIGAGSIGWQTSGGDTFVYANTSRSGRGTGRRQHDHRAAGRARADRQ